jgi:outer membrane protein assembly factor BamB
MTHQKKYSQPLWTAVIFCTLSASASLSVAATDWPNWRGPDHNGISQEKNWQSEFLPTGPKKLWQASIGTGFSSLIVSQGQLYTMGNKNDEDAVYCFDALTGKTLWKHTYPSPLNPNMYEGGPSATPTVDQNRLYTLSKLGLLFCLDVKTGKPLWSRDIDTEFEYTIPTWGLAGSPLIVEEMVIINIGLTGMAFNKLDGKPIWQGENGKAGYASPVQFQNNSRNCLAMLSGDHIAAVDRKTGTLIWKYLWKTSWDINAADPIISGTKLFVSSGYGTGSALLNIQNESPVEIWKQKKLKSQLNGPVLWQGHIYGFSGNVGKTVKLSCLDFETGQIKWSQEGFKVGALFIADGKLIILNDGGNLVIAQAKPQKYQEISQAKILDGKCWTVPILANGLLYARNATGDLVCLDLRKP